MDNNNKKPVNAPAGEGYVRTPEDDERDQAELKWKQQRANEAIAEFIRNHPDGRTIPRAE